MNCTADVRPDRCEIWAPTQEPGRLPKIAAELCGLPREKVSVHTTYMGGGFGRRAADDFLVEAVHISKAVAAPIKIIYTREDDMRSQYFRPAGYCELSGGLDGDGWPVAWLHKSASQLIGGAREWRIEAALRGATNLPYAIPNLRVSWAEVKVPVVTQWWRGVGSSQNAFVTECFFDELCRTGGRDPVEARLRLLENQPRMREVVRLVAERAGWGKPLPAGRARGFAAHEYAGSFIAQVAEVSVGSDHGPRVHRVVCAIDCGQTVNPDTIEAQVEGAIVFGLTAALYGEMRIERGRVVQGNFDSYPLLRMTQTPRVETHIVASHEAPGGVGETGLPPIAPAVCNALFALTGQRIRKLPIGKLA
jgi:isoquinoline 1-oxidoreductase beta subunit